MVSTPNHLCIVFPFSFIYFLLFSCPLPPPPPFCFCLPFLFSLLSSLLPSFLTPSSLPPFSLFCFPSLLTPSFSLPSPSPLPTFLYPHAGGHLVRKEVAYNLMRLIAEGTEDEETDQMLRQDAVSSYLALLDKPHLPDMLIKIICWVGKRLPLRARSSYESQAHECHESDVYWQERIRTGG